jgi:hypothetical protein
MKSLIDKDGYFIANKLEKLIKEGDLFAPELAPEGVKMLWDGSAWVETATPEEIQAKQQQEEDLELNHDSSAERSDKWKNDGVDAYKKFQAAIWRKVVKEGLNKQSALNAMEYFDDMIAPLDRGAWLLAKKKINEYSADIQTKGAVYQEFYNKIKNKVDSYIQNNY